MRVVKVRMSTEAMRAYETCIKRFGPDFHFPRHKDGLGASREIYRQVMQTILPGPGLPGLPKWETRMQTYCSIIMTAGVTALMGKQEEPLALEEG